MNVCHRYSGADRARTRRVILAIGIGAALAESGQAADLEEIVVTAQKREQGLQDVPFAITAVTGDAIQAGGISRLEDLSAAIPNFTFAEAASGSDNIFVRGIGSGINYGFEQAVGQVIDGFFYGRSRFGRAAFLDVERVEILKGPQGALIGKNTSAGALNITTAKPTEIFEAWAAMSWEVEGGDGPNVEGAVSGPITDRLRGRLAVRYDGRDGYVRNVVTGDDEQQLNDITARGTLSWDLTDALNATVAYQYGDFDRDGRSSQLGVCGQALRTFDPDGAGSIPAGALFNGIVAAGEDCRVNYSKNVVHTRNGQGNFETFQSKFNTVGLTLNWMLPGGHTLTSLTGYSDYRTLDDFDADWTFAEIAGVRTTEDYEQWSQELRVASPLGERFDYIGGIFVQSTDHTVDFRRDFAAVAPAVRASNLISTQQDSETYAVFGQATWHVTDQWDLTLGGRYTEEKKEASQLETPTTLYTTAPIAVGPPAGPAASRHQLDDVHRKEKNFSPTATLQWKPVEDVMLYARVARGFKGGGFDMQLDAPQARAVTEFEYEEEKVTAYEIGGKFELLNGALQINVAAFRSEFDDLQVSTLNPETITFSVGNAASAISQGIEADFKWAATDALLLSGAVAYLDSEYDDFPDAACNAAQLISATCTGPGNTQDLGGRELPYSPEIAASFSGQYVWPIGDSLELTAHAQLAYRDRVALVLDLDPNVYQKANTKLDARVTLGAASGRWEVSVIGRNLTDRTTRSFGNDALGGPFMLGTYFHHVDPPRTIALQARVRL